VDKEEIKITPLKVAINHLDTELSSRQFPKYTKSGCRALTQNNISIYYFLLPSSDGFQQSSEWWNEEFICKPGKSYHLKILHPFLPLKILPTIRTYFYPLYPSSILFLSLVSFLLPYFSFSLPPHLRIYLF
jgi:hypothetical protein